MSGNVLVSNETVTRKYQLHVNELYEPIAPRTIKALSTCPSASEIRVIKAPKSSGGEFVFDTRIGKTQFLSNVFKYHYRIPFTVTPKVWPKASDGVTDLVIDDTNFIEKIFNNNEDIALAEQAIVQGETSSTLTLNDRQLGIVNNIAELSNITSSYYDNSEVAELVQGSQKDKFQSFEKYNAGANLAFKFLNEHCNEAQTTISPLNEQNIFSSRYQQGFSTRTPQWVFITSDPGKSIKVACTFWSYLKFSIGSTPNNESTLTGVEQFGLTNRLANNLASKIFVTKKSGEVYRYASIEQDTSDTDNTDAWLILKIITPPSYIERELTDSKTGVMKPYSISYPRIDIKKFGGETVVPKASKKFNQAGIVLGSIPRSIYVALLKDRDGTFADASKIPVNFGLISNLSVSIESNTTTFTDQIALDVLTTANGCNLDPFTKLVRGYPVKINLASDLLLPKDLVVGASGSFNLTISGDYYNQGEETAKYSFYLVIVNEDTIDFDGFHFKQSSGAYIDSALLSSTYFLRDLYSEQQKEFEVLGGGKFGDAVKWVSRNAVKLAKNAWQNREKIASTVGDVASLVKAVRGGALPQYNVSGGAERGTTTFGAGSVKKSVFK